LTIHNLAYQGIVPPEEFFRIGLDDSYFHWQRLEYYGKANLLKGGIVYADAISTVSPTYAHEIQQREFGCGLEGVLTDRASRIWGILNGIDSAVWNPETDPHLPTTYSARDLSGKASCRAALFKEAGIRRVKKPLLGAVTRLAEQKGLDLLLPVMEILLKEGYPFVVLGTGDPVYEEKLQELKRAFPKRLGLFLTFDNRLAHLIEAGSDMFLMPSRFEPCGLNQFYSMRYGTVPIVRATGGLADSVHPVNAKNADQGRSTGFAFRSYRQKALLETVREAIAAFADKEVWGRLVQNGMAFRSDWTDSADRYLELYQKLVET
jgi:starch synthase